MKTATKDPPSKTITEKKAEVQPVTEQLSDKSSASMVSDSILTKVKNEAQKMMKEGCSKAEAAREVYDKLKGKTRKELLTGSCVQCVELSLPCGPVTVA